MADDRAGQHVQRGEQGGGAVALVVMGHRLTPALDHRQRCLGAVEGLHRGLLIGAQHDRLLRRIQVQPDDIDQLLLEARIVGQLERLDQVRFEAPRRPHLLHSRFRHPGGRSHRPAAPMDFTGRAVVQCQIHDLIDLVLRDRLLATPTLADLGELDQPLLSEPGAPPADRRRRYRQRPRDSRVRQTVGCHQQRPRPNHLAMRRGRRARHGLKNLTLSCRYQQRRNGLPHAVDHTQQSPINCRTHH